MGAYEQSVSANPPQPGLCCKKTLAHGAGVGETTLYPAVTLQRLIYICQFTCQKLVVIFSLGIAGYASVGLTGIMPCVFIGKHDDAAYSRQY